ncbi:hypothetical protein FQR65_LT04017 [Abscondita terminalis]|nr:hypothetical protein FQR65_LT04017 [Abscondita terminalis]
MQQVQETSGGCSYKMHKLFSNMAQKLCKMMCHQLQLQLMKIKTGAFCPITKKLKTYWRTTQLETQNNQLGDDIKILQEKVFKPEKESSENVEELIQEIQQREKRKKNLVIYGVRENNAATTDEQTQTDLTIVNGRLTRFDVPTSKYCQRLR